VFSQPGALAFLDGHLAFRAGTAVSLEPWSRTVALESGELDVTAPAAAPLRVATPRFVVNVRQARAVFTAGSVHVLDGRIEVYSLGDRLLATVPAGGAWPPVAAPQNNSPPSIAPPAPAVTRPSPARAMVSASAARALDRARAALADGDPPAARRWLDEALAAHPSMRERAEAELSWAESFLVEHEPDRAIEAFRRVATAYPRLPEGESAAFAAAQVLSERGRHAEAADALRAYLARHPDGRFAREARDRLAELSTPE
jgi:TolA-binding protein